MLAGIERRAGRGVDLGDALALEQRPELAIDRRDALDPRVVGDRFVPGVDRPVEVVGEHEDLADQVFPGEAEHGLALLRRAASVVGELGALALEAGEVVLGLLAGGVALDRERLDVGQQLRRRDVDLVGPLLCPCALAHAVPPGRR